jgi:hypothetical protein
MTDLEMRFIENHLQLSNRMIAQKLNLTEHQVKNYLHREGITRTQAQREQICQRNGEAQKGENNPNFKNWRSRDTYYYRKRSKEKYPQKERARQMVYRARKSGKLMPEPCFICGETENIEAHHPNYDKPLSVIWLCPIHHREIENEGSLFSGEIKSSVFHTVST